MSTSSDLDVLKHCSKSAETQGVILYGEPGTGKTLLAKAVANSTSATFLRVVGSELIQKYLGDGPKLVRELFRVAEELAPTIVFIGTLLEVLVQLWNSLQCPIPDWRK